jgi:sporulation protein YlmC with PRC-barrel domain
MTLLSELDDKMIYDADGARLGRVHEVRAEKGRIVALECGAMSWIERLTGHGEARHIPWRAVREVRDDRIIVDLRKPAAPRRRSAPRPASGRRSKR